MDYLKRPIEIEILGLKKSNKPTNSSLCGWQVYVLGIFFFLWDGEIKFDLHPNLRFCYQKQQHTPH